MVITVNLKSLTKTMYCLVNIGELSAVWLTWCRYPVLAPPPCSGTLPTSLQIRALVTPANTWTQQYWIWGEGIWGPCLGWSPTLVTMLRMVTNNCCVQVSASPQQCYRCSVGGASARCRRYFIRRSERGERLCASVHWLQGWFVQTIHLFCSGGSAGLTQLFLGVGSPAHHSYHIRDLQCCLQKLQFWGNKRNKNDMNK